MKIVLDTTTIRADYHLQSPTSLTFLNGLKLIPATLFVPEVVIDEAVNGFRADLMKALDDSTKAEHDLRRLLGEQMPRGASLNVEHKTEEYRRALLTKIASVGGEILPYPKIEHKKLVQRDLERRRPFRETGVGYRDALIWETVRSLTWGGHERVVFVSANARDFGDGPLVHEELRPDVLNPQRLTLVKSIAGLNQQLILPKMKMLDGVRADLQANRAGVFDLAAWINAELLNLLWDHDELLAEVVGGLPEGAGSASPSEIVEIKDVRVLYVRRLSDTELLVRVDLSFDADVSISWQNDSSASVNAELRLGVDLVVDRGAGKVLSEEVGALGGPGAEFTIGAWEVQNDAWEEERKHTPDG